MAIAEQLPAHLVEHGAEGTDLVKQYLRPSRLKVIQANATDQFGQFQKGCVIATPSNVLIANNDEYFYFVPLLFYMEWYVSNPFALKSTMPFIRTDAGRQLRTFDPASEIANKSRMQDTRTFKCPEDPKYECRYVEAINFLCWIVKNEQFGRMPALITFQRGEHKRGSQLRDLISLRAQQKLPIYANVIEAKVPKDRRKGEKGDWYGIDVGSPTQEGVKPFVKDPGEFNELREAHLMLKKKFEDNLVVTEYDSDDVDEGSEKFA